MNEKILNPLKGKSGEETINWILKFLNFYGYKGKVFKNIYVKKANSETAEIDLAFVSSKGIFVIESKNYSGTVSGDEQSAKWKVVYGENVEYEFYSPVAQNKNHIRYLMKYLDENVPVFSVVVFSKNTTLKEINIESQNTFVISSSELSKTISVIFENTADSIEGEQFERICSKIKSASNVSRAVKKEHIKAIKNNMENNWNK